ncbi:MAG: tetratricopeptide repeat protein [Candidatus Margulisiibacteriota bacterium]
MAERITKKSTGVFLLLIFLLIFTCSSVVLAQETLIEGEETTAAEPASTEQLVDPSAAASESPVDAARSQTFYEQGYLYYENGDFVSAEKEYTKAIQQNPANAKALFWLAKSQLELGKYASAEQNLVCALKLDPALPSAPNLLRLVRKKSLDVAFQSKPKLTLGGVKKDTISLDLVDIEVSKALKLFAEETGLNLVVDKNVYGTITINLKNATLPDALDKILQAADCTFIQKGNAIHIFSSGEPPDLIKIGDDRYNKTFTINYTGAENVQSTLMSIVPADTKILTTKTSSKIVVEGNMNTIKKIAAVLRSLDVPPKQVLVEANIIQVNHSNASKLAANLKYTSASNPNEITQTVNLATEPDSTSAQGFYYSVTSNNMEAVIEALQTKSGYNLLSSPKVLAMDGEEAEIITGSRLGYYTKTVTTTGMIQNVEFLDVGTKLTITPSIKSDGQIMMEIHPEISTGSIVNELPQKDSTETTTKLLVKDGQTIIIGGLIKDLTQDTKTGVPILADIPFLGALFRQTQTTVTKNEFIILIRPRIVDAAYIAEMGYPAAQLNKERIETKQTLPLDLFR